MVFNSGFKGLKKDTCPRPVQLNKNHLPQTDAVKYLGVHLDRKLAWRNHISAKRKQLDLKLRLRQTLRLQSHPETHMDIMVYNYGELHPTLI